ncbi:MAG: succinyl-diaminopimelate desuccinylase, partial [Rhizobium giardinii]
MTVTDPVANLATLIRCPSVTPSEGGALSALEAMLKPLGFAVDRVTATEDGTPDIENLYARLGTDGPHLMFAGHTDVVPVGDEAAWTHGPFSADISDGEMYGRGAVDMKGGIACFAAAVARHIEKNGNPQGSISFLITGDEEGPAINGTVKLLEWAAARGERWDACLVGEPTNPDRLGDMIKIGRRGSLSGTITVHGVQGHAAYPHLADSPVRGILALTQALMDPPFDAGTDDFQPSNLEVTTIDVANKAVNVIPAKASARFNIRFNDTWSVDSLKAEIIARLDRASAESVLRPGRPPVRYDIVWSERPSHVFLTRNNALIASLSGAVQAVTGREPTLSTTGGTSDARFIKDYCPVVEFGLVGQTMHMV